MDGGHTAAGAQLRDGWGALVTHLDLDQKGRGHTLEVAFLPRETQKKLASKIRVFISGREAEEQNQAKVTAGLVVRAAPAWAETGVDQQTEQIHHAGAHRDTALVKMSPAEGKRSAEVFLFKHKMSEMLQRPAGRLSSAGLGGLGGLGGFSNESRISGTSCADAELLLVAPPALSHFGLHNHKMNHCSKDFLRTKVFMFLSTRRLHFLPHSLLLKKE